MQFPIPENALGMYSKSTDGSRRLLSYEMFLDRPLLQREKWYIFEICGTLRNEQLILEHKIKQDLNALDEI